MLIGAFRSLRFFSDILQILLARICEERLRRASFFNCLNLGSELILTPPLPKNV